MNAISKAFLLSILIASYFMTYLTFATVKYDCTELLGDEVVVKSGGLSGTSLVGGVFPISFVILIYFGFEIYLYKKTKDGFLKKLYLIPLVLILVFIISIFIGGIIANSFQDGIAGGIFMAIIVEIGGVIILFFSIRIVLHHLLLKFFQKLGYFFEKYFNVIFTVLLIIFVLMTVIFFIDYKLNGKIIGLSRDGMMDCKDDFFNYTSNSRDLMKEKWNEMSYDEQLFLASKFFSNEEQQRWINRNRLVYTSFPEDPNFLLLTLLKKEVIKIL